MQEILISPTEKVIILIGTFNAFAYEVKNILNKYWQVLCSVEDLKEVIDECSNITFRRVENLKDILSHRNLNTCCETNMWLRSYAIVSFSCGRCTFCKYLPKIKEFCILLDGRSYQFREIINCQSTGLVYTASCTCPKLYVGQTVQEFH